MWVLKLFISVLLLIMLLKVASYIKFQNVLLICLKYKEKWSLFTIKYMTVKIISVCHLWVVPPVVFNLPQSNHIGLTNKFYLQQKEINNK